MSLFQRIILISFLITNISLSARGVKPWSPQNPGCQWPNGAASGAVSFTYDDSLVSQLDNGAPFLESMGARGTFFVMNSRFDAEFAQLERVGHEVSGHSAKCDVNESVVAGGRQLLNQMGAFDHNEVYAYPCGRYQLQRFLPKYGFFGARGVRGVVNLYDFDRFHVGSFSLGASSNLHHARRHYQTAQQRDGWAVYHLHHVDGRAKYFHEAMVKETVNNPNLWVAPFGVVLKCAQQAGYTR